MSCAPACMPSYSVPTCVQPVSCSPPISYPIGGLGSLSSCCSPCGGLSYGGSGGLYYGGLSYGGSGGLSYGGATSAGSLGILRGASVSCVNQLPPSEVVVQPSACVMTLPGPVLSASCEPVRVGGYTACGGSSSSSGSLVSSGSGLLGSRQGLVCWPC